MCPKKISPFGKELRTPPGELGSKSLNLSPTSTPARSLLLQQGSPQARSTSNSPSSPNPDTSNKCFKPPREGPGPLGNSRLQFLTHLRISNYGSSQSSPTAPRAHQCTLLFGLATPQLLHFTTYIQDHREVVQPQSLTRSV